MHDISGDESSGNLRFKANGIVGGADNSPAQGSSAHVSPASNTSSAQHPCIVDGAVLLETEHVLLRTAPHLLACTDLIRRDGVNRPTGESLRAGFRHYEVTLPKTAIQQIIAALERGFLAYGSNHKALRRLIGAWAEILGRHSN